MAASLGLQRAQKATGDLQQFDVQDYLRRLVTFMAPVDEDGVGRRRGAARIVDNDDDDDAHVVDLDWAKLGRHAQGFISRVPAVEFMLGPMAVEQKVRKVNRQVRIDRDLSDVKRPEELQAEDIQKSENETTRNIASIRNRLVELGPTHYWTFVLHPKSFSQSVENMFYCAFLAKDGQVAFEVENGEPFIRKSPRMALKN